VPSFLERFLSQPLYYQILLVTLVVLVVGFLLYILWQLIGYSLALTKTKPDATRMEGVLRVLSGATGLSLGVLMLWFQDWLRHQMAGSLMVLPLGFLAAGVYLLADGLGVLLLRRSGVGVVLFIWSIVIGVGWLVYSCVR